MWSKLFGKRSFLDSDVEAWCLDTWAWMLRNLGGLDRLTRTPLFTPSPVFFPPSDAPGDALGAHVFACVKRLMGMEGWNCQLEPYDRRDANARVGEYWFVHSRGAAPGYLFGAGRGGPHRLCA